MTDRARKVRVNNLKEYLKYSIPKEPLNVMSNDEAKIRLYFLERLNREDEVPDHLTHIELKQSEYLQGMNDGQKCIEELMFKNGYLKLLNTTLLEEDCPEITFEDQQGNKVTYVIKQDHGGN